MPLELYGTRSCPYTAELRDELRWEGKDFVEYDVENDAEALRRLSSLLGGASCNVPVLVEGGNVIQVGYNGRSCYVAARSWST
jgi:mycoredoxin